MRFAGTRMESFMGDENRPDFGNITESALAYRNKEDTTYTDLMGKTAATGIAEAGKVEAAGIVGAAQASAAQAQGQAAIMEGIGGIASSAIGAFGGGGGLPKVGTVARANADMNTLRGLDSAGWSGIAKGLI